MCLLNAARVIVKGSLVSTMNATLVQTHFYYFLAFCLQYPTVVLLNNNSTDASYTVNCQKKCSYRSRLGRREMLSMTKQRKRENRDTVSVVKAPVIICPYVERR